MAAKGSQAKEQITKKIISALGNDFIAMQDKKIYTWADDGGERVQIAISMTMPKTRISIQEPIQNNDWTNDTSSSPIDISDEDRKAIERLKEKLGVID